MYVVLTVCLTASFLFICITKGLYGYEVVMCMYVCVFISPGAGLQGPGTSAAPPVAAASSFV